MARSAAEDAFTLGVVRRLDCPVMLVLNKIDAVRKEELLPLMAYWSAQHGFAAVVPISARKKERLGLVLETVVGLLPEGQRYFPRDQVTDQPERFLAAELIREKILMLTGEEVPYATAVVVERGGAGKKKKRKDGKLPVTKIAAAIYCERTGQKAILIGKQGAMLKAIGTAARKEIEALLGTRVFLELFVKVQAEWRSSRGLWRSWTGGGSWRRLRRSRRTRSDGLPGGTAGLLMMWVTDLMARWRIVRSYVLVSHRKVGFDFSPGAAISNLRPPGP